MSRAINVNLEVSTVRNLSVKHGAAISAIEAILSGGTRVVYMNASDAQEMRAVMTKSIINGSVIITKWVRNA